MALIAIRKGWNLISFPWIPVETSVAGVFADSEVVDILAYDSGIWSVASRGIKGASPRKYAEFEGTITQVDARLGYWVNAAADSSLEFSLADELRPTSYEIEISAGWNLIAVLTGGGPAVPDIDRYLANIDWSVAYSYSGGSEGRWQRMLPGQQQWLQMGKGYWVWARRPGRLEPLTLAYASDGIEPAVPSGGGRDWWVWWFHSGVKRKVFGTWLAALLSIYLVAPLLSWDGPPGATLLPRWINVGQNWETYLLPIAALLLLLLVPSIDRVGAKGIGIRDMWPPSPPPQEEGRKKLETSTEQVDFPPGPPWS